MKILIPNASSSRNVGERILLESLVGLINKSNPDSKITIHSFQSEFKKEEQTFSWKPNLSYFIFFENKNLLIRLIRFFKLVFYFIILNSDSLSSLFSFKKDLLFNICSDYKNSELIIFIGGSYFKASKGLRDSVKLFINFIPIIFSKYFRNRKVLCPINFGPYYYQWQEKLTYNILKSFNIVVARGKSSFMNMKKLGFKNIYMTLDPTIYKEIEVRKIKTTDKNRIGVCFRNWTTENSEFDYQFIQVLQKFCQDNNYKVSPVILVEDNGYGGSYLRETKNFVKKLKKALINVLPLKFINNTPDVARYFNSIDMFVTMRTHPSILAAIYKVPFIAINKNVKVKEIMNTLGEKKYYLEYSSFNSNIFKNMLNNLDANKKNITKKLNKDIRDLKKNNYYFWNSLLS